jgi:hypothetical protein
MMIDIGLNAMFDNIKNNFTILPKGIDLPRNLVAGANCEICVVENASNAPVGTKFTGNWHSLIFNGFDISSNTFYFMTHQGGWVEYHLDDIVEIIVEDDYLTSTLHNDAFIPD